MKDGSAIHAFISTRMLDVGLDRLSTVRALRTDVIILILTNERNSTTELAKSGIGPRGCNVQISASGLLVT